MPKKKTTKSPTPSRAREAAQKRETPSEISVGGLVFEEPPSASTDGRSRFTVTLLGDQGREIEAEVDLLLDRAAVVDFFEPGASYVVTVKREKA